MNGICEDAAASRWQRRLVVAIMRVAWPWIPATLARVAGHLKVRAGHGLAGLIRSILIILVRIPSILPDSRSWHFNACGTEHPEDQIEEDGLYGGQTRTRLARTPVAGFAAGTSCAAPTDAHSDDLEAIEVYWYRQPSGTYALRALASEAVVRVVYRVDGYIVGESTRGSGSNFPIDYSFSQASTERFFEVVGYSAAGQEVAHGRGLLDVTDGTAVYIKQLGAALYEIGLERAPDDIAFVKVDVDERFTLTDQISGQSLSARLAVRSYFSQTGNRDFAITTYNADGSMRGTLRRTFELR